MFWGATVQSFDVDLKGHTIELVLKIGDNKTALLRFVDFYTFKFDYSAYGVFPQVLEKWDIVELSEIYFLPELKVKASHESDLHSGEFDFLLELYRSRLLIKARSVVIDNVPLVWSHSLPSP
jgi:hypothetical protein